MKIKLVFEKSTKNTHRYEEVVDPGAVPVIRNMYVSKAHMPTPPVTIEVTITAEEE